MPIIEEEQPIEESKSFEFTKSQDSSNIFVIDYTNRKIRVLPGVNIATSTKKFLKLSPDFLISGVLECDATVTSVDGDPGTEATLNSYAIPLNMISRNLGDTAATSGRDFRKAGNAFRVRAAGRYTTDDAASTVALALKVGSTTYHTITTTAATVTNAPWMIDWFFIVSAIGASGTAESYASAKTNNINKDAASTATITIDTTAAQTISLTATWTGGSAGDDISIRQFSVELLN